MIKGNRPASTPLWISDLTEVTQQVEGAVFPDHLWHALKVLCREILCLIDYHRVCREHLGAWIEEH